MDEQKRLKYLEDQVHYLEGTIIALGDEIDDLKGQLLEADAYAEEVEHSRDVARREAHRFALAYEQQCVENTALRSRLESLCRQGWIEVA